MEKELMLERVLREIARLRQSQERLLLAIDGRCASGKSTLAQGLSEALPCNLIHMDDFFLRPEQRSPQRYAEPGGNVDRERFLEEVLLPLRAGRAFSYRPFDCHAMALGEAILLEPKDIAIVEGTYSCHPDLWTYYDLRVFLSISPEKQLARLAARNAAALRQFRERWIPLEERYFAACQPQQNCELIFET